MDLMEKTGLKTFIGKVNMDRNGSLTLQEASAVVSAKDTVRWLEETTGKYENVKPILTPRFTPSCSDELMTRLAEIQRTYVFRYSLTFPKTRGNRLGKGIMSRNFFLWRSLRSVRTIWR